MLAPKVYSQANTAVPTGLRKVLKLFWFGYRGV